MAFDWKSYIIPAAALLGTSALSFGSSQLNVSGSRKAQIRAYNNQRALNQQAFDLSKEFATWQNLEGMSQIRQGLENAGYNPMLAVNASPSSTSFSGGSAGSFTPPPIADLGQNVTNAYKAFNLEKKNVEANTNATNASASLLNEQRKTETYKQKQIEADTAIKYVDKLLGDKKLNWYDKKQLMEIKTGYMNAQANHLASEAAQLNAHTAQANYRLNKGITDYENVNRKALADFLERNPEIKSTGLFLETLGLRLSNFIKK